MHRAWLLKLTTQHPSTRRANIPSVGLCFRVVFARSTLPWNVMPSFTFFLTTDMKRLLCTWIPVYLKGCVPERLLCTWIQNSSNLNWIGPIQNLYMNWSNKRFWKAREKKQNKTNNKITPINQSDLTVIFIVTLIHYDARFWIWNLQPRLSPLFIYLAPTLSMCLAMKEKAKHSTHPHFLITCNRNWPWS